MAYTVGELIEDLQKLDPKKMIAMEAESHDYWDSIVANRIGEITEENIQYSDYHMKWGIPKELEEGEISTSVVILKMSDSDELTDELRTRGFIPDEEEED